MSLSRRSWISVPASVSTCAGGAGGAAAFACTCDCACARVVDADDGPAMVCGLACPWRGTTDECYLSSKGCGWVGSPQATTSRRPIRFGRSRRSNPCHPRADWLNRAAVDPTFWAAAWTARTAFTQHGSACPVGDECRRLGLGIVHVLRQRPGSLATAARCCWMMPPGNKILLPNSRTAALPAPRTTQSTPQTIDTTQGARGRERAAASGGVWCGVGGGNNDDLQQHPSQQRLPSGAGDAAQQAAPGARQRASLGRRERG